MLKSESMFLRLFYVFSSTNTSFEKDQGNSTKAICRPCQRVREKYIAHLLRVGGYGGTSGGNNASIALILSLIVLCRSNNTKSRNCRQGSLLLRRVWQQSQRSNRNVRPQTWKRTTTRSSRIVILSSSTSLWCRAYQRRSLSLITRYVGCVFLHYADLTRIAQIVSRNMTNLTPAQLEQFESTFRYFDKDETNTLEPAEMAAALASLGIVYSVRI